MNSGFYEGSVNTGEVFVTRDWLISRYPDLANQLLVNVDRRIGFAGRGFSGGSPYSQTTSEVLAPAGILNQLGPSGGTWTQIARNGSTALRSDGTIWSWGTNTNGQLGDGTQQPRSSPVQVRSSWKSVASSGNNVIAVDTVSNMYAWGGVPLLKTWSTFDAYSYTWLGIDTAGGLFAWGSNTTGQLGQNNITSTTDTVQIGTSSWSQVAAGYSSMYAIRSDGTLWAWGDNYSGQLGKNDRIHRSSPTQIGTESNWTQVATTIFTRSVYALRSDGSLFAWGDNFYGQLGQSDSGSTARSSPTQIGTSSWTSVSSGEGFAAAIRSDGALFTWGTNTYGQLGYMPAGILGSPTQVGTSSWAQVSATGYNVIAKRSDGTAWVWGKNANGQLGQNDAAARSSPVQIGSSSWVQVLASGLGTNDTTNFFLRNAAGNIFATGTNYGNVLTTNTETPSSWTLFSASNIDTVAIKSGGTLWAWGYMSGPYSATEWSRSSPIQINSGSWSLISTNSAESLSNGDRKYGGNLTTFTPYTTGYAGIGRYNGSANTVAWGRLIGHPTVLNTPVIYPLAASLNNDPGNVIVSYTSVGSAHPSAPVQLSSTLTPQELYATGQGGYLMLATNGKLYGMGYMGDVVGVPQAILGGTSVNNSAYSWSQVSSGGTVVLAIRSDGTLWSWGGFGYGQLGDPTYPVRTNTTEFQYNGVNSPIQIGTSSWTKVSAGSSSCAAIRADGALFTWGVNTAGMLGHNLQDRIITDLGGGSFQIQYLYWKQSSPVQVGTSSWTQVSVGDESMLAIRSDGALFGWGSYEYEYNWLYTSPLPTPRSSPVQIGTSSWTQVFASRAAAAIRSDGALFMWGSNYAGALGLEDTNTRSSPVQVGTSSWTQVHVGVDATYAIRSDGGLFAWGYNSAGGLGQNDTVHRSSPVQIGTSSWTSVTGRNASLVHALRSDSTLWVWGANKSTIEGLSSINYSSPVQIGTSSWASISSANDSWMSRSGARLNAIKPDGTLWTTTNDQYEPTTPDLEWWRDVNNLIQVGNVPLPYVSSFVQIGSGSSWNTLSVSATGSVIAIKNDGTLWAWGENRNGQLGDNSIIHRSSMVQVSTSSWTSISAGIYHSAAIRSDGALFTWGVNTNGQLGLRDRIHRSSPVQVGTDSWTSVRTDAVTTVAVRSDGTLWAWGNGANGLNGQEDTAHRSSPTQIGFDTNWAAVEIGSATTSSTVVFASKTTGALYGWGRQVYGVIGDKTVASRSSPVQIDAHSLNNLSSPIQIGTSNTWDNIFRSYSYSAYFLKKDSILYEVKFNFKNIPTPHVTGRSTQTLPVQIGAGGSPWSVVDTSDFNSYAITANGALWAWGSNVNGEVGNNTATLALSPVQVGSLKWTTVSAGYDHALAIRSDGTLWAWGYNDVGQLGNQVVLSRSSPVQIGYNNNWRYVCAGTKVSGAITTDNALYVWGINTFGQLGDGTRQHRSSPVQIGNKVWSKVITFNRNDLNSAFAIDVGGNLFGWGESANNSLGTSSTAHRSSPVQIGTAGYGVLDISSANNSGIGIYVLTDGGTLE